MNDKNHPTYLAIDDLLIRAIEQGNAASRSEITRRQIAMRPIPRLGDFLLDELMKARNITSVSPSQATGDLEDIDLSDAPDMICTIARRCRRDGFAGQGMRDMARAAAYIDLAADNPRVMDELPESGLAFWKSAEFHYRLWKKQQQNQEKAI